MNTDLSTFTVGGYKAGPKWKVILWYFFNYSILYSAFPWPQSIKKQLLILFGSKIGGGVIIKTRVRVKNPWRLVLGNNCFIGEGVWIDNLEDVWIGDNVCLSQGSMLLTGNHDYTKKDFAYRLGKIWLHNNVWIGANSVVCPGVTCKPNAVLDVNSVATKDLDEMKVYAGNPAVYVRQRT
jgi:putative colanic acid biosynthesis acetyltransferase WcaF